MLWSLGAFCAMECYRALWSTMVFRHSILSFKSILCFYYKYENCLQQYSIFFVIIRWLLSKHIYSRHVQPKQSLKLQACQSAKRLVPTQPTCLWILPPSLLCLFQIQLPIPAHTCFIIPSSLLFGANTIPSTFNVHLFTCCTIPFGLA